MLICWPLYSVYFPVQDIIRWNTAIIGVMKIGDGIICIVDPVY